VIRSEEVKRKCESIERIREKEKRGGSLRFKKDEGEI